MNEFNYENAVAQAEIRRTPNMSFDSRVISVHSITERVGGGDRYRGASKAEIPETGILPMHCLSKNGETGEFPIPFHP